MIKQKRKQKGSGCVMIMKLLNYGIICFVIGDVFPVASIASDCSAASAGDHASLFPSL